MKWVKTISYILGGIVALLLIAIILIRIPKVQKWLIDKTLSSFEKNINGHIEIKEIDISFFKQIEIHDFSITSNHYSDEIREFKNVNNQSDTLLYVKKLQLAYSFRSLFGEEINLKKIAIEGGVFNLQQESEELTNIDRIFPSNPETKKKNSKINIKVKHADIDRFRFTLNNPFKISPDYDPSLIDFADLDLKEISICAKKIHYLSNVKDTVWAELLYLRGLDKSGFKIEDLRGDVIVTPTQAKISNVYLSDGYSKVNADFFSLSYANAKTLSNFVDSVVLETNLKNSRLDFATLGKMAPSLKNSSLILNIDGDVKGTIASLSSRFLKASTASGQTVAELSNVTLNGLPDPSTTYINGTINNATTNGKDLALLLSELTGEEKIDFFDRMPADAIYSYSGILSGTLLDPSTKGVLRAKNGEITLNTLINTSDKTNGLNISGNYSLNNFNAGHLLGTNMIGKINATGNVNVSGSGKDLSVNVDSIRIASIELKDRTLNNLEVKGKYLNSSFTGTLASHDPNLNFKFDGIIPFESGEKNYIGQLKVNNIDLAAMGIDNSGRKSRVSMDISANVVQTPDNDFLGYVNLSNTKFAVNQSKYGLGDIKINSAIEDDLYNMTLRSDFMRADYTSQAGILDFIEKIKEVIIAENFSNILPENFGTNKNTIDTDYKLEVTTYNTQNLCALLMDGLYIQSGTNLALNIGSDNKYNIDLKSGRLAVNSNYLKNITLNANNSSNPLNAKFLSSDVELGGFSVDSTRINIKGGNNIFDTRIRFHNDTTHENITDILANLEVLNKGIDIALEDSKIQLKGREWKILPSQISITDSLTYLSGLNIVCDNQSLSAKGTLSKTIRDSLGISMNNFDLSLLDQYIKKPLDIKGYLSGRGVVSINQGNNRMYAYFNGDSVSLYNAPIGKLLLRGRWNPTNKNYDLQLQTKLNDKVNCNILGYYRPEDSYLDINSSLNDLSVTYFEPLLSSIITNTSGALNGKVRLYGHTDSLILTGEDCKFDNFCFTLDYNKVPYTLNGPIEISQNGITFKNNIINDQFNGTATLSGGVTYKHFKDIKIDTRIRLNNLQALATTEKDNGDFYGDAFASGQVRIEGDMENLNLNIQAQTQSKTFIHIPISKASTASQTNLLTFVERENTVVLDPYDTLYISSNKATSSPMRLKVNVQVTANNNAEVWLEVDKNNGDIIKAKGNGTIKISVDPAKDNFALNGNYVIEQGSYHFVLMGITSRDFSIVEGSSVTLNGSPDNIDLNITGLHKRKAPIYRLIGDTSSVSTPRQVEAYIYIKGKLSEPQISFAIEIPDIDPTTKAKVQSALNSEEKIQKQVAALLVSGGFIPDIATGVSQTSSYMISSSVSALISDQVDKIFNELGIPIDLGINYIPGEKNANDAFEVALSTQLFNNRVTVNGNIGNDPYASNSGRDVIGNVDIEVKLDRKGGVKLNLFSHSTDRYSNDLEESQRNGIGISYQREFNSFKDLFRRKSPGQKEYEKMLKQREKEDRQREKEARQKERKAKKLQKKESKNKKD